jgi:hypothetical protein
VVYFQGGGLCWDRTSTYLSGYEISNSICSTEAIPWTRYGIFDKNNNNNPYKNYTIVNILYCSGRI